MPLQVGQLIPVGLRLLWVQRVLGSGSFGTVYKAVDETQTAYALKEVICKPTSANTVGREVDTMSKARHANIVQILDFGSNILPNGDISLLIAAEYCPGGDLNTRLIKPSSYETNLIWIFQISDACSFLHSLNPPIVHRDLKPDNIMLDLHGNLKLGDFGLAREYPPTAMMMYYMTSGVGTLYWMAPEVFCQHYTEKADIFSLGGIFNAILTRDFIQVGQKYMYGVFATYPLPFGKVGLGYAMAKINPNATVLFASFQGPILMAMMQLIRNMLDYNPHNRPSASCVKKKLEYIYCAHINQ